MFDLVRKFYDAVFVTLALEVVVIKHETIRSIVTILQLLMVSLTRINV